MATWRAVRHGYPAVLIEFERIAVRRAPAAQSRRKTESQAASRPKAATRCEPSRGKT